MNLLRGTVIKPPDNSPGLLIIGGQQRSFLLAGVWKSPVAPATNMAVEVELDHAGSIVSITTVDRRQLTREKLDQFGARVQESGEWAVRVARRGIDGLIARMGKAALGAGIVFWITWFFMPFHIFTLDQFGVPVTRSFTYWDHLAIHFTPGPTSTVAITDGISVARRIGRIIGILAMAAPIAAAFVRNPRAKYLNLVPLVYLLLANVSYRCDLSEATEIASAAARNNRFIDLANLPGIVKGESYQYGAWFLFASSAVLSLQAFRRCSPRRRTLRFSKEDIR